MLAKTAFVVCATTVAAIAAAQDDYDMLPSLDVTPVGDVRIRGRMDASRDLVSQPLAEGSFPLLGRMGVQAIVSDQYVAKIVAGSSGQLGVRGTGPDFYLDEAFLETRMPWTSGAVRIRAGRQAVDLFSSRLVSSEAFLHRPRRLDSIRCTADVRELEIDAFVAMLDSQKQLSNLDRSLGRSDGDYLAALSLNWHLASILALEAHILGRLATALNQQDNAFTELDEREPMRIATVGWNIHLRPLSLLNASAGLSYQLGEMRSLDHQALDLSLRLNVVSRWRGKPTLQVGYDFSSGDNRRNDNHSNSFDAPLSTSHRRYGGADLLQPSNAQDLFMAIVLREEGSQLSLSLHRLALASSHAPWIDVDGEHRTSGLTSDDNLLGFELDFEATLVLADPVSIDLLYAVFWPDDLARSEVGPQVAHQLLAGVTLFF